MIEWEIDWIIDWLMDFLIEVVTEWATDWFNNNLTSQDACVIKVEMFIRFFVRYVYHLEEHNRKQ